MIRVKDLFKKLEGKQKDLITEYIKLCDGENKSSLKKLTANALASIKETKAINSDTVVGIIEYLDEFEDRSFCDTFCFYPDDIKDFSCNETNKTGNAVPVVQYAFEFNTWEEILGFYVSDNTLKSLGEIKTASCILYEMTWLGYEKDLVDKKREKFIEKLDEAKENIKTGAYKGTGHTFEELKKELDLDDADLPEINEDAVLENKNRTIKFFEEFYKTII